MSIATQSVLFNALPLLLLAAAYLVVAAALVPLVWRDRSVAHPLDIATVAVFPAVAIVAAVLGALVLRDDEPVGGHIWATFMAVCVGLVPPLLFFARWRDRALVATGVRRAQAAEELVSLRDREMEALAAISTALARAHDLETAARPLVQQVHELLRVEFAGVTLVNDDATQATGVVAVNEGEDVDWFRELRLDLRNEPSGIASAVFEVAPIIAYDCKSSPNINQRLVELVGAESGIWVPIVAQRRVVGVLLAVTTSAKHVFTADEIALMQALAGETALALDRMSSAAALADALEREQRIAAIARRVRGELGTDEVIRVVAEELRSALSLEHVAVQLGDEHAAGIPIRAGASQVGTIVFERSEPLTEGERLVVEAVAREVGLALQTARLVAEKQRRLAQQSALLEAVQVVLSELELDVALERLVEEVAKLLEADAADCYLLDPERGVLRCAAVHGLDENLIGLEIGADEGVSGLALQRERPIHVTERSGLDARVPHAAYLGFSQVLVAPMVWGGAARGVLGVGNRAGGRAFERADTELLETFAGLVSVAMRNAESLGESRNQARVQRAFFRIASLLSETLSLAETYDVAAQAAAEALGGDFAAVLTVEGGELGVAGAHDLPDPVRALPPADTLLQAAIDGSTIASSRIADDDRFDETWRRAPFSSLLATPVEGSSRGLVVVFFRSIHAWSSEDLEFARQVGRAARGALERSRLYETERTARALSQQLARTGTLLGRGLDPAAVLEEVVEQAVALLDADAGAVAALEGGELVIGAAQGEGVEQAIGTRAASTGWLGGDVVQLNAPVAREDVAPDSALGEADAVLALGHRAYLGVPLAARDGSVLGVLSIYNAAPRAWREDEREALAALAANASVALANAELYQRLALEHEQSVAILSNVADGIVAVDRAGRVVAWNAAAEEITGVPAEEAIGGTPLDVLRRELRSETGGSNRLVPIMRGNEEVWLSLSETVMRDPTGAVAGRIFAFRDMSAERFAEQMRSDFVSTVSHELRAPLTSIYGFAATLLRKDIDFSESERATFLGYIASESEQLTRIVDALLSVARLDGGQLDVELQPTDVRTVLAEALPTNGNVEPNSHSFVLDLADDVSDVNADPDKLREIVDQLIDNAVKYSPDGGVVRVEARRRTDAVEISVADEGVGIPAARIDRIFDKFFTGGESHPGTGLGLFIAQGLVAAMGGKIWVNSNEGRGSRFTFELPVAPRGEQG